MKIGFRECNLLKTYGAKTSRKQACLRCQKFNCPVVGYSDIFNSIKI